MWSCESRGRQVAIERKTKRYPSDLTDEEWLAISPFLPGAARTGRKRRIDWREVLNAIRYMVRSGCEWRMLPVHFPPWQTVYWWFRRFVRLLLFRTIHDVALMIDRERAGRDQPSAAILDFVIEIVRRSDPGFTVLPKRWVVEQTFGWLTRYRRLVRDYEARIDVSKAMIYAAMTNSLIRRIVHP